MWSRSIPRQSGGTPIPSQHPSTLPGLSHPEVTELGVRPSPVGDLHVEVPMRLFAFEGEAVPGFSVSRRASGGDMEDDTALVVPWLAVAAATPLELPDHPVGALGAGVGDVQPEERLDRRPPGLL